MENQNPTRYMFVCCAGNHRSPTAAEVALNLAARSGMNLEAEFFGTNQLQKKEKAKIEEYSQKFSLQDRIFVMERSISDKLKEKIEIPENKITCFNIEDDYFRGEIKLREALKEKIKPWITFGNSFPGKKYALVSIVTSNKAELVLKILERKQKENYMNRGLIDYITFGWENIAGNIPLVTCEEYFYDRIFIVDDRLIDALMMPKPLSRMIIDSAKNPEKYRVIEFIYTPQDSETSDERILNALREAEK